MDTHEIRDATGLNIGIGAGLSPDRVTAIVLPPSEGFSAVQVGAVGLMVRLMAAPQDIVIGHGNGPTPFANPRLEAVAPAPWWKLNYNDRYCFGVIARLHELQPDRIEVHNRPEIALAIARAFPKTPMALFIHNDPQAMRSARSARQRAAILKRMQVICVSDFLRQRYMEGVRGTAQAMHLPNAVELQALPKRLPMAEREQTIVFAGRVVADKGTDAFIRAWAAVRRDLPGWRAAIIGADRFSAASPETPFLQMVKQQALSNGVEMAGYLPHSAVMRVMARAAIVVVPSRWQEPFGLTALEAMANGAALICAPRGGLPEVAGDAALFADPDAEGELEAAIRELALDGVRRAALADAGLERARRFDAYGARARLQAARLGPVALLEGAQAPLMIEYAGAPQSDAADRAADAEIPALVEDVSFDALPEEAADVAAPVQDGITDDVYWDDAAGVMDAALDAGPQDTAQPEPDEVPVAAPDAPCADAPCADAPCADATCADAPVEAEFELAAQWADAPEEEPGMNRVPEQAAAVDEPAVAVDETAGYSADAPVWADEAVVQDADHFEPHFEPPFEPHFEPHIAPGAPCEAAPPVAHAKTEWSAEAASGEDWPAWAWALEESIRASRTA